MLSSKHFTIFLLFQVWKTLEETEKSLNDKINLKDYDVSSFFLEENHPPKSPHEAAKRRGDRIELEGFYLEVTSLLFIRF